jgi:predicted nucleic acid-binding protein
MREIKDAGQREAVTNWLTEGEVKRTYVQMKLIVDTSALLAVALNKPQRPSMITASRGCDLVASEVLPFEVGNALVAMVRRRRLKSDEVLAAWDIFGKFPISFSAIDIRAALKMALRHGIYAYDAYVIQCAVEQRAELLTLDERLKTIAEAEGVTLRGAPIP